MGDGGLGHAKIDKSDPTDAPPAGTQSLETRSSLNLVDLARHDAEKSGTNLDISQNKTTEKPGTKEFVPKLQITDRGNTIEQTAGDDKSKAKPAEVKPSEARPSDVKSTEAKSTDTKPTGAKPTDAKPNDTEQAKNDGFTSLAKDLGVDPQLLSELVNAAEDQLGASKPDISKRADGKTHIKFDMPSVGDLPAQPVDLTVSKIDAQTLAIHADKIGDKPVDAILRKADKDKLQVWIKRPEAESIPLGSDLGKLSARIDKTVYFCLEKKNEQLVADNIHGVSVEAGAFQVPIRQLRYSADGPLGIKIEPPHFPLFPKINSLDLAIDSPAPDHTRIRMQADNGKPIEIPVHYMKDGSAELKIPVDGKAVTCSLSSMNDGWMAVHAKMPNGEKLDMRLKPDGEWLRMHMDKNEMLPQALDMRIAQGKDGRLYAHVDNLFGSPVDLSLEQRGQEKVLIRTSQPDGISVPIDKSKGRVFLGNATLGETTSFMVTKHAQGLTIKPQGLHADASFFGPFATRQWESTIQAITIWKNGMASYSGTGPRGRTRSDSSPLPETAKQFLKLLF